MEAVIRAHHAHCVRFFDCGTESRQIDFPQGAFADVRVVACTVCFLVVEGIMLDTGRNIILLYTFYKRNCNFCCQIRIFAHIFKVTAAKRRTVDVDARCKDHVFAAPSGFTS